MAEGGEYDLPPVHLLTAGVAVVNVNSGLGSGPPGVLAHLSQYGSAGLRYSYSSPGHVRGSMQILNTPESLIYGYSFVGVDTTMTGTQTLEGLWWRHDPGVGG